jgi:CDP-diacylglycerol--glycerol-3-phosphate 3-phosphatidyltransferase
MEKSLGGLAKKQTQAIAWNIPNLLSVFRILTVPFVVVCLFYPSPAASFLAALIFGIASITDLLDGYIARYQKSETAIGQLLDPLADKLLINSALIMLIPLGRIPAWMVVLIVAREVAVTGLRGIASIQGLVIAASGWGKAKTIFQTFALIGLLLHYEHFRIDFHVVGMILMWIALAITVWSGFDYFYKFYRAQAVKGGGEEIGK